jgi:hypothetical protein
MPFIPNVRGLYPFKFLYNLFQVILCSYMFMEAGMRAYSAGYTMEPCNAFDHKNPPITFILYVFYLSKILDFLDTVFIILEKRWKQLSFLHVYHHTSIFLVSFTLRSSVLCLVSCVPRLLLCRLCPASLVLNFRNLRVAFFLACPHSEVSSLTDSMSPSLHPSSTGCSSTSATTATFTSPSA